MSELLEALNQDDTINRLMDEVHRAMLSNENEAIDEIRQAYTSQMRKLLDDLVRVNAVFMSGEKPSYSDWKQLQLDVHSARVISENMNSFRQQLVDQLGQDLNDFYRNSYNMTSWVMDQTTPFNIEPSYNLPPNQALSVLFEQPWSGARFSDRVWKITDEWALQIQNEVRSSILNGDSVADMAQSIRDYVGIPASERLVTRPRASAQLYRATLIARTELIRAARMAQNEVFQQNEDLIDDKVWSAKPGMAGVCEDCQARDGLTPDQIELLGDDLYPDPPAHPNCRCSWIPKVKSWDELLGPYIKAIKASGQKINPELMLQPNEYGNMKPVSIEPYQEWSMKYLTPAERGE